VLLLDFLEVLPRARSSERRWEFPPLLPLREKGRGSVVAGFRRPRPSTGKGPSSRGKIPISQVGKRVLLDPGKRRLI